MKIHVRQDEIVLCIIDFLKQAGLARSMRTLEQETGLVVDEYGNDLMFLRGLILDGAWRDAENFVMPLARSQPPEQFDAARVLFEIRRQRFLELVDGHDHDAATTALADGLKQLEAKCSREEFNKLCYCLTLENLTDHPDYADWTPFRGRLACFESVRHEFDRVLSQQWTMQRDRARKLNPNHLVALLHQAALYQASVYLAEGNGNGGRDLPNPMFFDLLSPAFQPLDAEGKVAGPRGRDSTSTGRGGDILPREAMNRVQMQLGVNRRSDGAGVGGSAMYPLSQIKVGSSNAAAPSARMRSSWAGPSQLAPPQRVQKMRQRPQQQDQRDGPLLPPQQSLPPEQPVVRKKPVSWEVPIGVDEHPDEVKEELDEDQLIGAGADAESQNEVGAKPRLSRTGEAAGVVSSRMSAEHAVGDSESGAVDEEKESKLRMSEGVPSVSRPQAQQHLEPHLQEDQQYSTAPMDHKTVCSFAPFGEISERHAIRSVAFSPDGTRIAIGTNGRSLKVLACPSAEDVSTVLKSSSSLNENKNESGAASPASLIVRPKVLTEFDGLHLGSVYDVSWSPDSSLLATCSNDMTVKVARAPFAPGLPFDMQARTDRDAGDLPVGTLRGHDGTVRAVCFTGDGTIVSGGAGDHLIRTWDPNRGSESGALSKLKGHTGAIFALRRGDVGYGNHFGEKSNEAGGAGGFGPSTFVSGSEDRSVRVWDLRAGGKCVWSVGADPGITHLEDGTPAAAKSAVQSLSVSPLSTATVVTGHEDGTCCVWDLRGGRLLWMLRAHESQCRSVDYDRSGRWILSASFDGTVSIADADVWERRVVKNFVGHRGKVLRAVWHPSAHMFASSSADSTVKLWAPSVSRSDRTVHVQSA
eukprot:g1202.t1